MKWLLILLLSISTIRAAEKKPYRIYLRPGSVLTRISDKTEVKTDKGIYADVLETSPTRRETFVVYDKKGKPAYLTDATGIVEIEDDIRILPKVDASISYPPPVAHQSDDKFALLDTNFNIHLENYGLSAFNPIYETTLTSVIAPRIEMRTLYNSDMPVNFGVSFNYQNVNFKGNDEGDVDFTIFSFGPQIEKVIYNEETLSLSVNAGGEFAPVYKAVSGEYKEEYSAMLFDIGVEATWSTQFGKYSLGSHFRHHDLTLSETNRPGINPVPETITTNSIGVMAGYKYEWNL